MNLILVGPPGVGKGSQAKRLSNILNVPHISTGDMFRKHFAELTPLGKKAKEFVDKGLLVPDDVTNQMVVERLCENDCQNGFILDGYPRNLAQADFLNKLLEEKNVSIDYVIDIECENEVLVKRLTGRRVCTNCGAVYHIDNNPPKVEGICDVCGSPLVHRKDDEEGTVRKRLEIYHEETFPLINYYTNKKLLLEINGNQTIEAVTEDILKGLGKND